jgi:hypothetical protein
LKWAEPGRIRRSRIAISRGFAAALRITVVALLAMCSMSGIAAQTGSDLTKEAGQLLRKGDPAAALILLQKEEDRHAGDPAFDYLLGVAALDSGRPAIATLAFERVLAVDPAYAGARVDMARAYFLLKDYTRALAELDLAATQDPPETARLVILKLRQAIDQALAAKKTVVLGYTEITLGRDTNVNSSGTRSLISVPALGGLQVSLSANNIGRHDYFSLLGAGAEIAHELTPALAVFAGTDLRYRSNFQEDTFDYRSADVRGGMTVQHGDHIARLTLGGGRHYLDNQMNRDTTVSMMDYRYALTASQQLNLFASRNLYRFAEPNLSLNNFDQNLLGAGWIRGLGNGRGSTMLSLYGGHEHDLNGRADGAKNVVGLRGVLQYSFRERLEAFASVMHQRGHYGTQNAAFQVVRGDRQSDVVFGGNWQFAEKWSLRPQLLHTRNFSNIAIYEFRRTEFSLTLRRQF